MENGEFREIWPKLEWENSYSIKFRSDLEFKKILDILAKKLKASVVSVEGDTNYLVCNLGCSTFQGTTILINMCLQLVDLFEFECRIRSSSENVVKSLSAVIGDTLKGLRDK
jgi:vesicle coat complex subunit